MATLPIILGINSIAVSLLLIGLSIPLLRGRIKPNHWYGFRFPESFASDAAWYATNRYGARRLIVWAVVGLFVSVALLVFGKDLSLPMTLMMGVAPALTVLSGIESWRFAKEYAARQKTNGG